MTIVSYSTLLLICPDIFSSTPFLLYDKRKSPTLAPPMPPTSMMRKEAFRLTTFVRGCLVPPE